jgi:hypothetical protein
MQARTIGQPQVRMKYIEISSRRSAMKGPLKINE